MSQLLKKSENNIAIAKYTWRSASLDDSFISNTCYHLQQALELALKHLLELNAIEYPRTHNIRVLLDLCHSINLPFEIPCCVENKAPTYTNWEASSRYNDNFMASKTDVEELFNVLPDFVKNIGKLTAPTTIPDGAIKWCRDNAPLAIRDYPDSDLWEEMKSSYYKFGPDSFSN